MKTLADHAAMVDVLAAVFGSGKEASPKVMGGKLPEGVQDMAAAPTFELALAGINRALRFG